MLKILIHWRALVILISAVAKIAAPETDLERTIRLHNLEFYQGRATYKLKLRYANKNPVPEPIPEIKEKFLAKPIKKIDELAQKAKFSVITTKHKAELAIKTIKQKIGLDASIPKSYDWRKHGIGISVKRQGKCGSCWAIVAKDLLEAFYKIKTGKSIELSIQFLVDCSDYEEDAEHITDKCDEGNLPGRALNYVLKNGICLESVYRPYAEKAFECDTSKTRMSIGFKQIIPIDDDEEEIKEALYRYGPLTASIYAPDIWFDYYSEGVYSIKNKDEEHRHSVVIVGYGYDEMLKLNYWILKNSWGPDWGERGYMRMAQGDLEKYIAPGSVFAIY